MLDELLNFIAPHYCCSCGQKGQILCHRCKSDINFDGLNYCLLCGSPIIHSCTRCRPAYAKSWVVGKREGALKALINQYKFSRARSAYRPLAQMLADTLPQLPPDTVIVPIPTIAPHVRARGYDQVKLMAKQLAKLKSCAYAPLLARKTNTVQHGATRTKRQQQAKQAFCCRKQLNPSTPYLIVDDISTTGATVNVAAKVLKAAGATKVWVAVVAWQPHK